MKEIRQIHLSDAMKIAKKLNIPVEFLLGLSAAESGRGTSNIVRNANNFFGLGQKASGRIGTYTTSKGAVVAKFMDFKSSAESFATDFGKLVKGKKSIDDFVNALIPKFNTADPKTNGNPNFKKDTKG